jgi:hypothetical protein
MTIDERLDRLVERHEALTQSVELLWRQSQKHDEVLARNEKLMADLILVVRSHENRLDRLEGQ